MTAAAVAEVRRHLEYAAMNLDALLEGEGSVDCLGGQAFDELCAALRKLDQLAEVTR